MQPVFSTSTQANSDKDSVHAVYQILKLRTYSLIEFADFLKDLGANLGLSQKPTFLLNITESQIRQSGIGHSEAVWGHALRLRAPSEHLIEFSHDKIATISPRFFSHPLGAQQGSMCLFGLREMREEREGM